MKSVTEPVRKEATEPEKKSELKIPEKIVVNFLRRAMSCEKTQKS